MSVYKDLQIVLLNCSNNATSSDINKPRRVTTSREARLSIYIFIVRIDLANFDATYLVASA